PTVVLGSDASDDEWQTAINHALTEFPNHPHILQRLPKSRLVDQPFLNSTTGEIEVRHGQAHLRPYYFVIEGKARLRGALTTIHPSDKNLPNSLKDAIAVPTAISVS